MKRIQNKNTDILNTRRTALNQTVHTEKSLDSNCTNSIINWRSNTYLHFVKCSSRKEKQLQHVDRTTKIYTHNINKAVRLKCVLKTWYGQTDFSHQFCPVSIKNNSDSCVFSCLFVSLFANEKKTFGIAPYIVLNFTKWGCLYKYKQGKKTT